MNDEQHNDELNRIYQSVATESVPPHIDDAVLKNASSAARHRTGRGWMWPATWLATGALAVLLALNVSLLQLPTNEDPEAVDNVFRDAASATAEQIENLNEPDMSTPRRMSNRAPDNADSTPGPDDDAALGQVDGPSTCPESERANSSRWWTCIEDLQRRGHAGSAAAEMEALLTAFPNFAQPVERNR